MSELSDVTGGQIIGASFTNQVKERTVMRYASAATRDTSIPIPVEGSLAYLLDVNQVTVYNGSVWEVLNAAGIYLPLSGGTLTGDVDLTGNALLRPDTQITELVDADTRIYVSLTAGVVTMSVQVHTIETGFWTVPAAYRPSAGSLRWISPTFTLGFGAKNDVSSIKLEPDGEMFLESRGPGNIDSDWAISTFTYVQDSRGI